jgi:hypothetical protein
MAPGVVVTSRRNYADRSRVVVELSVAVTTGQIRIASL